MKILLSMIGVFVVTVLFAENTKPKKPSANVLYVVRECGEELGFVTDLDQRLLMGLGPLNEDEILDLQDCAAEKGIDLLPPPSVRP